ncbi:Platelet glycoprotein Ib beta chain [Mactra antiquata]
MAKFETRNIYILCLFILLDNVISCPTSCKCRGQAAFCKTGFKSFPSGLDATTQVLKISGTSAQPNAISTLSKSDFSGASNLLTLEITFSGVQNIPDEAFGDLSILRELSLADNNIHIIKPGTFKGLTQLRTLDLSGNKNCQFDRTMFTYIQNIEELNLGDMGIRELENDFFQTVKKLKVLKLYINELKHIHQDLLAPLTSLETLDINGNHLLGLPSELKPKFETMKLVHMSENPWQCNCQLVWLRSLPQNFVSSKTDTSNIVCNGPRKLRFQSYVTIPDDEFICIPPKVVRCQQTSYSLDVNHRLVISCEFEGDPIPQIKWNRPDGFEIVGRNTASGKYHIYENGTLVIDSVSLDDNGDWSVTAYNRTAQDEESINVHVIVTTTSTTTTSTTTVSTPTKSTTAKKPATVPNAQKSTSTILTAIVTKASAHAPMSNLATNAMVSVKIPDSTETVINSEEKTVVRDSDINYGLLAAAAAAGGTLVGIISIIVMCCKKKQPYEQNKIEPFQDDFGGL